MSPRLGTIGIRGIQRFSDRIGASVPLYVIASDGFDVLDNVDVAGATNLDAGTAGVLKPTMAVGSAISQAAGSNIGNMTENGGLAAAFDGTTSQANTAGAGRTDNTANVFSSYVGKTHTSAVSQAVVHGSNSHGYTFTGTPTVTIRLYGKQGSAPANATDGTLLGSISFTDTGNESSGRTIPSNDLVTVWDHRWVTLTGNANMGGVYVAEVVFYGGGSPNNLTVRSSSFTAASAPTKMKAVIRVKEVDAATANTDYTLEFSRDDGANWALATITELFTAPGSIRVCETNLVDVSGQPSGTNLRWRFKTLNNKMIELDDLVLCWK